MRRPRYFGRRRVTSGSKHCRCDIFPWYYSVFQFEAKMLPAIEGPPEVNVKGQIPHSFPLGRQKQIQRSFATDRARSAGTQNRSLIQTGKGKRQT
jgi:hypothetical protein